MKRFLWTMALCASSLAVSAFAGAPIRYAQADRRVEDSGGRFQYIVTLDPTALAAMSDDLPAHAKRRFIGEHPAKARNLVLMLEKQYGFEHLGMTSAIGLTITANLAPEQVAALSRSRVVRGIEEVARLDSSAPPTPPWGEIEIGTQPGVTERYAWGRVAARGIKLRNGAQPRIYVVDTGVGYHNDLNVVVRVNPNRETPSSPTTVSPVGCYSHATHIAGIIGARGDNAEGGTAGVLADAAIHSVAVSTADNNSIWPPCGTGSSVASVHAAFEWILQNHPAGTRGVVTLSWNGGDFAPGMTLHNDFLALRNAGLVVVQSAGNQADWAAYFAFHYEPPSPQCWCADPADGILVVGGLNANGTIVRPPNGYANPWVNPPEPGTNFGGAIDVWAPSLDIYSTWGVDPSTPAALQPANPGTFASYYLRVSGTSMAAPYVAGIAAAILSKEPWLTPAQVEDRVRAARYTFGEQDNAVEPATIMLAVVPEYVVRDDLVEHYYNSILNRFSDPGGKAFWLSEMTRLSPLGVDPRESYRTIAKQFFFSPEYSASGFNETTFVSDLYQAFYQRQPDSGGLNFWVGQFPAQQREGTHNNFMFAAEFDAHMHRQLGTLGQRQDTAFVVDAFRAALGRLPSDGELTSWRSSIYSAKCSGGNLTAAAQNVVWNLFHSTEHFNRGRNDRQFLTDLYEAVMHRGPDSGGLQWWVDQLAAGYPRDNAINAFFGSPEWTQGRIPQLQSDPC